MGLPEDDVTRRTVRQSIVFFIHFDNDAVIEPLKGRDVHPSNAGKIYNTTNSFDYVNFKLNGLKTQH